MNGITCPQEVNKSVFSSLFLSTTLTNSIPGKFHCLNHPEGVPHSNCDRILDSTRDDGISGSSSDDCSAQLATESLTASTIESLAKFERCRHHPTSFDENCLYPCSSIHNSLDFSLLLLSRNTYMETYHMYYALYTVHLCSTERPFEFLTRIGYVRRQQLVSISLQEFDKDAERAFQVLRTVTRLEHIKFHLPGCCSRQHLYRNLPGMAELREIRELCHVEVTSAHDCSNLIAAMMRPRLPRFTSKSEDDDQKLDFVGTSEPWR